MHALHKHRQTKEKQSTICRGAEAMIRITLRNNTNWIKVWQDWVAIADTRWQAPPWVLFMFCAEFWARKQPGNRKDLLWIWQIENINRDFTNATDDNTFYCTELRLGWWPPVLIVILYTVAPDHTGEPVWCYTWTGL